VVRFKSGIAPAGWWSRICLPPCITRTPPLAAMPHDSFAAILARPWLCGPVGIGSAEWPAPKWGNCRPAMIFGSFVVKRLGFFFVSKKPNGLLLFDGINGLGSGGVRVMHGGRQILDHQPAGAMPDLNLTTSPIPITP